MKLAALTLSLFVLVGCERKTPDICNISPPYDDSKYEEWRKKSLEAGCDKQDGQPAAKSDTA
jgi:hypothetical protein